MKIGRVHSWKKEIAQYILLGLPTIILMGYVLKMANQYFELLENNWFRQTCIFGTGMLLAIGIFARRLRFITFTAILVVALYLVYRTLGSGKLGEFDAYYWSIRFSIVAVLASLGWISGYGFSRARFFSIAWSVYLLAAMVVVVSSVEKVKVDTLIVAFAPILAYSFYIIYMSELIRNMNEDEPSFAWFILKRFAGFAFVIALLIFGLLFIFKTDFDAVEKEFGAGGQPKEGKDGGQNKMTKNDGSGTTNNNSLGLTGSNSKANKDSVLFVAKLDNYFPDGKTPNPLYFTSDFFTKFDTETQTFEKDSLRPFNDLFSPDVSQVPLFFTKQDTSVIGKGMSRLNRKVVTAEVYKHNLSARLYTAPSTGFFVQPISVPDENKDIYRSAYKAKMYVSDLNSAYFIYNPYEDKALKDFQEQRFEKLRGAGSYAGTPKNFMDYYTFIPQGSDYDSIRILAKQIISKANAKTPVDQVIAIRDYFNAKDENNQPTYTYSDNPGIPGLPSANKLCYFLFENKKGYCAYYAGATLFLMRALGIPSRVATGFLTVDRSNKNPGWYWFYEDQAHAWVQAYFPGYGWIDFDTTVPSQEQQQSPQPDQTPPLMSQTVWLVANGKALAVDTVKKRVTMKVDKMLYWDNPYEFTQPQDMVMDVSIAKITKDSGIVSMSEIKPGGEIVAVSYSEQFKSIPPKELDSAASLFKRFPDPAPIDEIKIMAAAEEKQKDPAKAQPEVPTNWSKVFWIGLSVIGFFVLLLFSLPWLVFRYLHAKAKGSSPAPQKAYWRFMASMYYLNQMGYERGTKTPAQFAAQVVDPTFKTRLTPFMNTFLKTKYSREPLNSYDEKVINDHYPVFYYDVKNKLAFKYRFSHFLNFYRMFHFFTKAKMK